MLHYIHFLILTFALFSLKPDAIAAENHAASLAESPLKEVKVAKPKRLKTREASETAKKIINEIVNSVGLKANFEIKEANIANAAAVNRHGKRYILYDGKFMARIQHATQTDWAAVSILAHEIGHHLNGHTLMKNGPDQPRQELEADEFSGFVLRQMGASLEEAQKALRLMSSEKGSASHPGKRARMAAIEKGYIEANNRILAYAEKPLVKMVASQQEEPVQESRHLALAGGEIFKEVHFNRMPQSTFYLTRELKLVGITQKGPAVLGGVSKSQDRIKLYVNVGKGEQASFRISSKGALVDESNKVVGYIKNPA